MWILEMRTRGASPLELAIKCLNWRVMPYCYCDEWYNWFNSIIDDDDDDCWVGGLILFKQFGCVLGSDSVRHITCAPHVNLNLLVHAANLNLHMQLVNCCVLKNRVQAMLFLREILGFPCHVLMVRALFGCIGVWVLWLRLCTIFVVS